ncbi:MAG: hypothetical protein JRI52_07745 [Deltaproteobacteria bacterium]|nr:hypothetical protein [Deltaproteobacteria bacterium]
MINYEKQIANTIHILNLAEVNIMEISENGRKRSLDLEFEITEAANKGDEEKFFRLLDEWREILMEGMEEEQTHQKKAA